MKNFIKIIRSLFILSFLNAASAFAVDYKPLPAENFSQTVRACLLNGESDDSRYARDGNCLNWADYGDYGPMSGWNTSNVTDMNGIFSSDQPFTGSLNWDVSKVTNFNYAFMGNQNVDLTSWNVEHITSVAQYVMFGHGNSSMQHPLWGPPKVSFYAESSSGSESNAGQTITVSLDKKSAVVVTVAYEVTGGTATASADYTGLPKEGSTETLTFDPDVLTQSITFSVVADTDPEDAETITLKLSGPNNAVLGYTATHTFSITNVDKTPSAAAFDEKKDDFVASLDPFIAGTPNKLDLTVNKVVSVAKTNLPVATSAPQPPSEIEFSNISNQLSAVFDTSNDLLVATASKTRSITDYLKISADNCKALDDQAYAIDCINSSLEVIANVLPDTGDYARVKVAFEKGSDQLTKLMQENASAAMPSGIFPNITRPLKATNASESDIKILNKEINKIYDEIKTTLLRAEDTSDARKLAYQDIATVLMSNKVLLRSSNTDMGSKKPNYSGSLLASRGVIDSDISYTKSSKSPGSDYTTYTSSDFSYNMNADKSISTGFNGQVQFEKMINETILLGYFVGGSVSRSSKSGSLSVKGETVGATFGTYFVTELENGTFLDGHAALIAANNNLSLNTATMTADSKFGTQAGSLGLNLTAVTPLGLMEVRTVGSLGYSSTLKQAVEFDVSVGTDSSKQSVTNPGNTTVSLGVAPQLRIPISASQSQFLSSYLNESSVGTITPSLNCRERRVSENSTQQCGQGLSLGIDTMSKDGFTNIIAGASLNQIGGQQSRSITLKIRTRW